MQIFRSKKDKELYKIYRVSPRMYTGSWYDAEHCYTGKMKTDVKLKDYVKVYDA